mgnify:CR=1 FL=1
MNERNIKVSLELAIEWYNGSDLTLRTLALQAFSKNELEKPKLSDIVSCVDMQIMNVPSTKVGFMKGYIALMILAIYFNDQHWSPQIGLAKYFISPDEFGGFIVKDHTSVCYPGIIYFQTKQGATEAIRILQVEGLLHYLKW